MFWNGLKQIILEIINVAVLNWDHKSQFIPLCAVNAFYFINQVRQNQLTWKLKQVAYFSELDCFHSILVE